MEKLHVFCGRSDHGPYLSNTAIKLRVTDTMPLRESSQWFVCTVLEGIILKMFRGET